MKEMQLFEVGFKERLHQTSYDHKVYVAARNYNDAITNARNWFIEDYENYDDWLSKSDKESALKLVKNMEVAKVTHIGRVIV